MSLRTIRVNFENGGKILTDINGTNEQIESHYIGKFFDLGNNPEEGVEVMVKAVSVEFL